MSSCFIPAFLMTILHILSTFFFVYLCNIRVLKLFHDSTSKEIHSCISTPGQLGLELAIDPPPPPPPPRGNFVHYDFLKLHYIRHKIKDVSPLRVAALTCNSTLYTLPPKIALKVPDNVSTMTRSYIFAC